MSFGSGSPRQPRSRQILRFATRAVVVLGALVAVAAAAVAGCASTTMQVTQYQIAVVETTLFDAQTRRLVWSGTSETFNPTSVQKDAPGFADLIVSTLQKSGLLPAAK